MQTGSGRCDSSQLLRRAGYLVMCIVANCGPLRADSDGAGGSDALRAAAPAAAAVNPDRAPRLWLRSVPGDRPLPASILASAEGKARAAESGKIASDGHYVVQFERPLSRAQREALGAAGIRLGAYVPQNAYVVRLPRGFNVAAALGDKSYVRWVGRYEPSWKRDPELAARAFETPERQALSRAGRAAVLITLFPNSDAAPVLAELARTRGATVHWTSPRDDYSVISATLPMSVIDRLTHLDAVQYVEDAPELAVRNTTSRWIVQSNVTDVTPFYTHGIAGAGQIVGIIDTSIDINHCSFYDTNPIGPTHRKIEAYNATPASEIHGTHTAGTAVGDAGFMDETRGVAYEGRLVYATIPPFTETDIVDRFTTHHNQGARVHSNSWGDNSTTAYNSLARGIDLFCYNNEDDVVLFAVSNGSIARNPENAKNLLAVGAADNDPNQSNLCSGGTGPTSDGRRKPEIYAPGCDIYSAASGTLCNVTPRSGTSTACPAVAGAAMLMRQYFMEGYFPSGAANPSDAFTPSAALIRATLLNSAVDMTGIAGFPSKREGWGRVLADNAAYFAGDARRLAVLEDVRNANGLASAEVRDYRVQVASSGESLKVTLVWTDPPATAGATFAAVNDLDIEVVAPDGSVYLGNVFSAGASVTGGEKDDRNNVEQVLIPVPLVGAWSIRVRAAAVNVGLQGYALIATGDVSELPSPLTIRLPDGPPRVVAPYATNSFNVEITPGSESVVPGSLRLYYSTNYGPYQSGALSPLGGNLYSATLPVMNCGDAPRFYVSADGALGSTITSPAAAPTLVYQATVGFENPVFTDDVETDLGWTLGAPGDNATTGMWERGDPIGTIAQPEDDHTPDPGVQCFFTGQGTIGGLPSDADVDNGKTTLISPTFDLSPFGGTIGYWRWYSNTNGSVPNADTMLVDISYNDGGSWTTAEVVGPSEVQNGGGWYYHELVIGTGSPTVKIRFVVEDEGLPSLVEAAVDDIEVRRIECVTCTKGDVNGDTQVNGLDVQAFVDILLNGGGTPVEHCAGDVNALPNGSIDVLDVPGFVSCMLGSGCP